MEYKTVSETLKELQGQKVREDKDAKEYSEWLEHDLGVFQEQVLVCCSAGPPCSYSGSLLF